MKKDCSKHWEGLVALAEGGQNAPALAHTQVCEDCAAKLSQLRTIFAAGDQRFYDAPPSLVNAAKGLMVPRRRTFGLLSSTLQWSGARAVAEDFQIVVGEGDQQLRLMYMHVGSEWQVLGRLPGEGWEVEGASDEGSGRFSFSAPDLAATGFALLTPDGRIEVPSAEELLKNGSRDSR